MNKYLLERYPLVWNARLLPMLALASCGHIFFILLGWTAKNEDFNYYAFNAIMVDFIGIPLLLHLVISILLLVVWLLYLSRNNAFKHFYPFPEEKLFLQWILYFLIVFASVSFVLSYAIVKGLVKYPFSNTSDVIYLLNFLLIITFIIATIVYCVRITNVQILLFTIVFIGVLSIILSFIGNKLLFLLVYVALVYISVSKEIHIPKKFIDIVVNTVLLFSFIVMYYVVDSIMENMLLDRSHDGFSNKIFCVSFCLTLVFIGCYTRVIQRWKAIAD